VQKAAHTLTADLSWLLLLPPHCSWSNAWGLQGSFRLAYGAAYSMQPGFTYALQFKVGSTDDQAAALQQQLAPRLAVDPAKSGCLVYTPAQPQRLINLIEDIRTLAIAADEAPASGEILADVVSSNPRNLRNLAAASRGPFKLCGQTAEMLRPLLSGGGSAGTKKQCTA
jgi:hypothetical protein